MPESKHDRIAKLLAKKLKTEYNPTIGPDIVTPREVDEVEVNKGKLKEGIRQLRGFRKRRYLAVPEDLVEDAKRLQKALRLGSEMSMEPLERVQRGRKANNAYKSCCKIQ